MNARVRDYIDVKTGKKSANTATEEKETETWLYGVKFHDSPVWENAPGISAEELYLYVCGKMPPPATIPSFLNVSVICIPLICGTV